MTVTIVTPMPTMTSTKTWTSAMSLNPANVRRESFSGFSSSRNLLFVAPVEVGRAVDRQSRLLPLGARLVLVDELHVDLQRQKRDSID